MSLDRLRRVTDLFVEGKALYLGMDDNQQPVVIWINKLNSFEVEESRRDGVTARGLRLLELEREDGPERQAMHARAVSWSKEELARQRVDQIGDELYLQVITDLESDEEWREKLGILRRMPVLLADDNAPDDDPRREQLTDLNAEYFEELQKRLSAKNEEQLKEFLDKDFETLVDDYMESWRNRQSLDEFMAERRATEIFCAMRECAAEEIPDGSGGKRWNHAKCNHQQRLLENRSDVKSLPEEIIVRVIDTLDEMTASDRDAGNSAAPVSSSAPSEPVVTAAESQPSSPVETPNGVLTT